MIHITNNVNEGKCSDVFCLREMDFLINSKNLVFPKTSRERIIGENQFINHLFRNLAALRMTKQWEFPITIEYVELNIESKTLSQL